MHLYELNTTNKLGTKGQLAMRYSELLKEVWTASTRSVAPLKLRFCMTKYAPQFAGGGQHDSQVRDFLLVSRHCQAYRSVFLVSSSGIAGVAAGRLA